MKTIILSIMLLFGGSYTTEVSETYVYICTGPQSKKYHSSKDCNGLRNCSVEIKKVTFSKAKSMKRTPCKICY